MTADLDLPGMVRVVLVDANVLYSRVLRDYLLHAADAEIVAIAWSRQILDEVIRHLAANLAGFTVESGARLATAMNRAFHTRRSIRHPRMTSGCRSWRCPTRTTAMWWPLPSPRRRQSCARRTRRTSRRKWRGRSGFEVMTPDALLSLLIAEYPAQMLAVHATSVARLRGATDASTIAALGRAGAPIAAARMVPLLESAGVALD